MLDYTTAAVTATNGSESYGLEFANGTRYTASPYNGHLEWLKYDSNNGDALGKLKTHFENIF